MPFKGLKVIELSAVLAGPSVGMFFAELGADVIKIENKLAGGDLTRKWKLQEEALSSSISAYYSAVNFGKKVLFKDLNNTQDLEDVYKAIKESDILIENFKSGDDEKFGLTKESVKMLNPSIIHAKIEGFPKGVKRSAFDIVLQAETGFISMNGTENNLAKLPVAFIDLFAAHQLKEGILVALLHKWRSGKGSFVKTNLYHSALSSLANQATNFFMAGKVAQPMGLLHPNIAPYGEKVKCKDGTHLILAIGTDKQFEHLMELLSLKSEENRLLFKTNQLRLKNRQKLQDVLYDSFSKINFKSIEKKLLANNIPFGELKDISQVLGSELVKNRILEEKREGTTMRGLKSVAFEIENY